MFMMLFTSLLFSIMNHPLTLGLILLIQTLLTSLITGMLNTNFWYSYILFLIMVGGMLILFIYMTSVASNEMFNFKLLNFSLLTLVFLIGMMILLLTDNFFEQIINFKLIEFYNSFNFNLSSMNKYFSYPNITLMFMIIVYLLITLIAVVKITNLKYGPLRQKF
uniref:NADH-ubiquinone oxidoreductase chain 6 n=1 Tax=Coleoptera sp. 2 KM-2017 TaxID=2219323 RepID=A0A346RFM6_9COLE|nr:NADH dehydrogenase subunit 6 [Coleoptera sp. 2 KM-2017]